jgi:Uma2 family endonuclease
MILQEQTKQPDVPTKPDIGFQEYLSAYEGQYAEWMMGKVEVHVTNNTAHNMILLFLSTLLNQYLGYTAIGELLLAGISMYLTDDKPGREPDLMIVLNDHLERIQPTFLDGPADIVIEIVSPESVERDYGKKFVEYEEAGIPEYWRIDPLRKQTDIYVLTQIDENEKRYRRLDLDSQRRLTSTLLPGFALDPAVLWQEHLPRGSALSQMVQDMLGEKQG